MNKWLQRWHGMATRERWLAYGVGLSLFGMLYLLLIGDPLGRRLQQQQSSEQQAQARRIAATSELQALQQRIAADPNLAYRSALLAASASREALIQQIDQHTAELVTPQKMQAVLQELLRKQPQLRVLGMSSFTEPVQLAPAEPAATPAAADKASPEPAVTLYRHGLELHLEGGYFDLLNYLQAVQASGWQLNWDTLDYQVGEAGPSKASIRLKLYTLSRHAGWVGV
ncbi:type II secretion system protein GspM [Pseudomonas sp. SL4(2022)]|uniref:type II secretion system protein GspM n=1 Tax=Pseudomonas sp. SL4(2022) TaxID=2994661 RepID=UPI0022711916|nr:type II secretion system protein GspM [Pseudomonas sp. SL4(2022)]WAC45817.1 type II secretion system protein GspM [Pseudomonas sp. SL4(2022)]